MKFSIIFSVLFLAIFYFYAGRSFAEGNWLKTSLNSNMISSIETTPQGIMVGEFDSKIWLNPFNGVYLSSNLGQTWKRTGLEQRGVTGISYADGNTFASTYYFVNNTAGLFKSSDGGKTWQHKGNNFSTARVLANKDVVLLGTYSHGLWVSFDAGETWVQKLGDGFYGPKIEALSASDSLAIVTTETSTYKSADSGKSWMEIPELRGKKIKHIEINENVILAGTSNNDGVYRSTDFGANWSKVPEWQLQSSGAIKQYRNVFYAGRKNLETQKYDVYESVDGGISWKSTDLNLRFNEGDVLDISWFYSIPKYLFAVAPFDGVYRFEVPESAATASTFLNIPWSAKENTELKVKIYSYFDHKYPLLGYAHKKESEDAKNSTLNYLGVQDKEPYLYYSSHDGYDFSLSYGTSVLAASSGMATFGYDRQGLGNYITIDHQNGYKTIYAHLQSKDLITKDKSTWVGAGTQIGLVGMTGNTTGAHLHFAVINDQSPPENRVDPFGWANEFIKDPWPLYSWEDQLGDHTGATSINLWNTPEDTTAYGVNEEYREIHKENKSIILEQNTTDQSLTLTMQNSGIPRLPEEQKDLKYINQSSLLLTAYNGLEQQVKDLLKTATLEISFKDSDLKNIVRESLKIYYWDEVKSLWKGLPSVIDLVSNKISGQTLHFSHFAILGEKIDKTPPITTITLVGSMFGGWFTQNPTAILTATDPEGTVDKTFYSLDNGITWEEYKEPFVLNKNGIFTILFKSLDSNDNLEPEKEELIKINATGKFVKTLQILDGLFSIK